MSEIKNLIICNPYKMPQEHWKYDRTRRKFNRISGRRPAGFLVATKNNTFDDPGEFREIDLVNKIRERVDKWRNDGYPNVTGTTRLLLQFWRDETERDYQFFFCQMEAIETLIWLTEAADSEKQGIDIPADGGPFRRLCCKMATGTGKTIVMSMLIAWQVLNSAAHPQDARFSKNILVMAPGLTIKSRLQVLLPAREDSFYKMFGIVPESLREKLRHGRITIHNWHALMPAIDTARSVVKLGKESNAAFARRILGHDFKNIIVINDEAHHAYRATAEEIKSLSKAEIERDKRWIEGLDKIHFARNIRHCFDFSATPFIPSGKNTSEEALFKWIVSDFSLNDAIESGLTKTPRVAVRDDSDEFSKGNHSRFYHLYNDDEVKFDLNRNAKPREKLPNLVENAYFLLGQDWLETKKAWDKAGSSIPPVMITICNKTQTAARVQYSFEYDRFNMEELSKKEHLLHIDSSVLDRADSGGSGKGDIMDLRAIVDTVGKTGKPGEQIRNIVAVQMLSEGWDARNVTHIMGLRAFSSQLLCEQVVGRGLRRTSYELDSKTGLFPPEHVKVIGVPFTFLPHEDGSTPPPNPPTLIEVDPEKSEHAISWPNIDRIDTDYSTMLKVDWTKVGSLELLSYGVSTKIKLAGVVAGKPHLDQLSEIDLYRLDKKIRLPRVVFATARDVYDAMSPDWKGSREFLLAQIVRITEEFIHSGNIKVADITDDPLREKMTILFSMQKIVNCIWKGITAASAERRQIHLNAPKPIKSTHDMLAWHTRKPADHAAKSHINMAPYDSKWERGAMQELERNKSVISWAKNDHIGFVIKYRYNGIVRNYWPDFLIKLDNSVNLVLEIKGIDDDQNQQKRKYLDEWTSAVNDDGRYGTWTWDVAFHPSEVRKIIKKHAGTNASAKEYAKCPACSKTASSRLKIKKEFGFRNDGGMTRPQPYCRACR